VSENTAITIENIHNPRWSYRLAKVCAENYLVNSQLPWLICRYFNVYGEHSKAGHFVADQIDKIGRGEFSIIGPEETRSFCYVSDAIAATIYCAQSVSREVVNIGNDREIRILDAANIIASALGHENVQWQIKPSLAGSTPTRRPNIDRLRQIMTSYAPISFEEAIARMLTKR
jgi:nucleoside-diphosphate-sugar epimerase